MIGDSDASLGRPSTRRFLYAAIGALQGGFLYLLFEHGDSVVASESLRIAVATWLIFAPTLFLFADQGNLRRVAAVFAGAAATLFALLYLSVDMRYPDSAGSTDMVVFSAAVTGIAIIALPFFRCWGETRRWQFPYPRLFQHAWNAPHIFVGAWVFVGAVWLVLFLWAQLFRLIGIDFFNDLFQESYFALVVTGLAFGLAVAILRDWARVVGAARGVVLALLRILAPVVASAVALFVLFLPFTGLETLWSQDSPTIILLSAAGLAVLLANSVVEDVDGGATANLVLNTSAVVLIVLLPILVGLSGVAAGLRIAQYGLTPERAYGAIFIGLAGLYALAYLWALAVGRRGWPSAVRTLNIRMAAVAAIVAAAVCTPALDVQRMSADNQVDRLLSGRVTVDEFDFSFLNFDLGHAGKDALDRLRAASDHPQHTLIVAGIEAAESNTCRWCDSRTDDTARLQAIFDSPAVRILPAGTALPADFRRYIVRAHQYRLTRCTDRDLLPSCYMLAADLFGDTGPEVIFIDRLLNEVTVFAYRVDDWDDYRTSNLGQSGKSDRRRLYDALDAGEMEVVTPSYRTVRAGGLELPIAPW